MDHNRPKSHAKLTKRIVLIAATIVALIGGGVTLANIDFSSQRVDRDKLSIETVQRGTMEIKVSANGQLLPKHVEQLASQVTGRVAKAHVKPGDVVKAGQLLVELSNPQLIASAEEAHSAWEGATAELQAAEADLQTNLLNQEIAVTQARFNLEKAQLQLEADTNLFRQQITSEIDFKRSKLNVAQITKTHAIEEGRLRTIRSNVSVQLAVKRSRATQLARALDRARNEAANLRIVSGIDGIVQAIAVEVGQQLQPGSPIGRIAQRDRLYAELQVPAREATDVQPGQHVVVDTRSGTVDGTVTRVDPAVTGGTVLVDVELRSAPPPGSRPQLPVEGVIYLSRLPDTLFVGKPSYVKTNAAMTVYKLDADGRYATRVPIKAGKLSVNHVQVLSGLKAGDRIITSEIAEFQDKQRILID
ncbi:MAG TPA: efflux RND transporter periplasmic adaptor subunit [Thermoanaerobaculia bacterium]